jgi:YVTN family beta-propeller protein
MKEIQFLPTGAGAHGLQVSRDTRSLYVSNRLAGSISVIDFATRRVTATWNVGGSPDMLQLSPDGRQLWASGRFEGAVYVIDTTTGTLVHKIRAGAGAHGLSYFPNAGLISTGHNGVYR